MSESPQNDKKGFAGLDSMVSDVSKDVKAVERAATVASKDSGEATANSFPSDAHKAVQQDATKALPTPSGNSGMGVAEWVIGALVVLSLIVVGSSGNKSSSQITTPTYSTAAAPADYPGATPNLVHSSPIPAPTYSTAGVLADPLPAIPNAALSDVEKPPIGSSRVLDVSQIRYCQIEKIRIEAIESVVDNRNNDQIGRFNDLVSDYNSRCGEFRYRSGDLQRVQQEVEITRSAIAITAKTGWMKSSTSVLTPTAAANTATTQRPNASRDPENFKTCISGDYPSLCKHELLTNEEAAQVAIADKSVNLRTCISGNYPSLCRHDLLNNKEAAEVAVAEKAANFQTCISGQYPSLCRRNLLDREEAVRVQVAEKRENYNTCIVGTYSLLCDHSMLSGEEAAKVANAEQQAKGR
jgi:hypothetical protein